MRRIFVATFAATLPIALAAVALFTSAGPAFAANAATLPAPGSTRSFRFTYRAEIRSIARTARRLDIWIPLPHRSPYQSVGNLSIESNLKYKIVDLPRYGNRAVHLEAAAPMPASAIMTVSFDAVRRREDADLGRAARPLPEPPADGFEAFLGPDRMIPVGGKIARVALKLGSPGATSLQLAHAIYQYVTRTMTYVHRGKGVGHGDALFACDLHHGNCTDFHSLFIALARARGIPARFIIGFPLGPRGSGNIAGYHCWLEFYAGGVWVPVDASKAWQMPLRHDYYFGHLDADRIAFTMGRDLELIPRQHGRPLNYFIYPYGELDGKALAADEIKTTFSYRDVEQTTASR